MFEQNFNLKKSNDVPEQVILNEAEERVPLDGGYSHSGTPFSEIPVEVQLKLGAVQGRETMMLGKRVRSFLR